MYVMIDIKYLTYLWYNSILACYTYMFYASCRIVDYDYLKGPNIIMI
jgi:hypothetical protein